MTQDYFLHEKSICETTHIGKGTRIWAFTHILPGAQIGEDCNICDGVFIENDVNIGDRVTIKCGVQLWDGARLQDDVFVGPNATFTNDHFPRSRVYQKKPLETVVEHGASIGANATVLPGKRIGRGAMIGAGAVVTSDVPAHSIVVGNPARIIGYTLTSGGGARTILDPTLDESPALDHPRALGVDGCQLWPLPHFKDLRGAIVPIEFTKDLPFVPQRQFFVFGVPDNKVRGEHSHRKCHQFLVALHGSLNVVLMDGSHSVEVRLCRPDYGIYMPPMIWAIQYQFSSDTVLGVYASHPYDSSEYIREYDVFEQVRKEWNGRQASGR